MTQSAHAEPRDLSVRRLMTISIITRIIVDTSVQLFGPFLPMIAQGLGTTVVTMGRLIAIRSLTGMLAPVLGSYADRHSYRGVLQFALACGGIGLLIISSSRSLWLAAIGMALFGIGFAGFVPTLAAYVSARLPYSKRARGIGILEYSWALTGILGLYMVGQIIEYSSWRTPIILLGVGMLISAAVFGVLPSARPGAIHAATEPHLSEVVGTIRRLRGFFRLGVNARSAYGAIVANCFIMFAAVQFMIIYGAWFNGEYGLTASQLGVVALVFGLFDLSASVSVSLFTDRIGKRRSVFIGLICSLAGYLLIPFLNVGLAPAVASIAFTRGFFEFSVVSNIPLLSEQVPAQRGKVLSLSSAFNMLAVALAGFTAPWFYTNRGIGVVAIMSATSAVIALVILILLVEEPEPQTEVIERN